MSNNTLKIKRNGTYDQALKPSSLEYGELAYYNAGRELFIGHNTDGSTITTTHLPLLTDLSVGTSSTSSTSNVDIVLADTGSGDTDNTHTIRLASNLTGVSSIINSALTVGRDSATNIDFSDANKLHQKANSKVVSTANGTDFTLWDDIELIFAPASEGTSLNTWSEIVETNTGANANVAEKGGLSIRSGRAESSTKYAEIRMTNIPSTATGQSNIEINPAHGATGQDVDFIVYDENKNAQINVTADSSAPMTTIRNLTIPSTGSIDINTSLNIDDIEVDTLSSDNGTTIMTLTSANVTFSQTARVNDNIKILSGSDILFEGASSSFSDMIRKSANSGQFLINNAVAGDTESDNTLELRNSIASGDILFKVNTGSIQTAMTIDGATKKVTIAGDLQVEGTTTTVNSDTITIADKNITIAQGATSNTQWTGAGITVDGANKSMTYDDDGSTSNWAFDDDVIVTGTMEVTAGFANTVFDGGTFS